MMTGLWDGWQVSGTEGRGYTQLSHTHGDRGSVGWVPGVREGEHGQYTQFSHTR